jgi:hypothetical protein
MGELKDDDWRGSAHRTPVGGESEILDAAATVALAVVANTAHGAFRFRELMSSSQCTCSAPSAFALDSGRFVESVGKFAARKEGAFLVDPTPQPLWAPLGVQGLVRATAATVTLRRIGARLGRLQIDRICRPNLAGWAPALMSISVFVGQKAETRSLIEARRESC